MLPLILLALAVPTGAVAASADQASKKTVSHSIASARAGATVLPGAMIDWSQSAAGDIVLTNGKGSVDKFAGVSRTTANENLVGGGQEIKYVEFH